MLFALMLPQAALAFCTDSVPSQYREAAQDLFDKGVLKGYEDGSCKLNNPINRAETVTFILRNRFGQLNTNDVQYKQGWNDYNISKLKGEWFGPFIAKGNELGIIKGDANNNLRPAAPVIDSEGLVMIFRSQFNLPSAVSGQNWYDPAYQIGDKVGMSTNTPGNQMTRGDVVRLIFEANKKKSEIENAISNYKPRVGSDLKKIAEEFDTIDPNEAAVIYKNMTEDQRIAMEAIASDFSWATHIGVCEADKSLTIVTPVGTMNCEQSRSSFEQIANSFDETQATEFAQRLMYGRMLVYAREACVNQDYDGDITPENCSQFLAQIQPAIDAYKQSRNTKAYVTPTVSSSGGNNYGAMDYSSYQTMSEISAGLHNSNMAILNNLGGGTNCLIGDYGCEAF